MSASLVGSEMCIRDSNLRLGLAKLGHRMGLLLELRFRAVVDVAGRGLRISRKSALGGPDPQDARSQGCLPILQGVHALRIPQRPNPAPSRLPGGQGYG
eukprot:5006477-Alexandrium_andersonii.AAC.1